MHIALKKYFFKKILEKCFLGIGKLVRNRKDSNNYPSSWCLWKSYCQKLSPSLDHWKSFRQVVTPPDIWRDSLVGLPLNSLDWPLPTMQQGDDSSAAVNYLSSILTFRFSRQIPYNLLFIIHSLVRKHFFTISINSDAYASELIENRKEMFPLYLFWSNVFVDTT